MAATNVVQCSNIKTPQNLPRVQFVCHKLGITEGERKDAEEYRTRKCCLEVISWTTVVIHSECCAFEKLYIALFSLSYKALENEVKIGVS